VLRNDRRDDDDERASGAGDLDNIEPPSTETIRPPRIAV
jgi:hypothetical protein